MDVLFGRSKYGFFGTSSKEIKRAMKYCEKKHEGQKRKLGGAVYTSHLFGVAEIAARYTLDIDVIVAALLHDVLEDVKEVSADDIQKEFGSRVANIIKEVSEVRDSTKPSGKGDWLARKKKYLEHMEVASREALLVCAGDKINNLRSIIGEYEKNGSVIWKSFNTTPARIRWYNRRILMILLDRLGGRITREFKEVFEKADSCLGWKFTAVETATQSKQEQKGGCMNPKNIYYDCWGVPAQVWFDQEAGIYFGGYYDVDEKRFIAKGDIITIIWDGFEISKEASDALIKSYRKRVFKNRYPQMILTTKQISRILTEKADNIAKCGNIGGE